VTQAASYSLDELLDEKNGQLYASVAAKTRIELVASGDSGWSERTGPEKVVISTAPSKNPCASFTHELLHASLELGGCVAPFTNDLAGADAELMAFFWNQLSHEKMFPKFKELGYLPEEFLADDDKQEHRAQLSQDIPYLMTKYRTGGRIALRGVDVALPYIASRSPHERHQPPAPFVGDLLAVADRELLRELDAIFSDWRDRASCDPATTFARLYKACGLPNVAFTNAASGARVVRPSDV
jgi:hypothetical protein